MQKKIIRKINHLCLFAIALMCFNWWWGKNISLAPPIRWEIIASLVALKFYFKWNSRKIILAALAILWLSLLAIFKNNYLLANDIADIAYFTLFLGVVFKFFEIWKKS